MIAAPIAAWLVRRMPPRLLGSLAGGMIVFTNVRTLLISASAPGGITSWILGGVFLIWTACVWVAVRSIINENRELAQKPLVTADWPRQA